VEGCGLPHLAKNERDTPSFLHAALDKTACAPFFKERRMEFAEPTKLLRKSGIWGTPRFLEGTKGHRMLLGREKDFLKICFLTQAFVFRPVARGANSSACWSTKR
jgi:hypothetical protein